jgi:excisionase family DNA binding protein
MAYQEEPLLTVSELAQLTKIAKSTLYDWVHQGYIPHLKLGSCVRFRASEVNTWLERQARPGRLRRVPTVEV